jgi:hypothetical protein
MLYLDLRPGVDATSVEPAVKKAVVEANKQWPGVEAKRIETGWQIVIPAQYVVGHEAHFGQVTEKYLGFLEAGKMPSWEVPNMIQKYRTIMEAYKMSR